MKIILILLFILLTSCFHTNETDNLYKKAKYDLWQMVVINKNKTNQFFGKIIETVYLPNDSTYFYKVYGSENWYEECLIDSAIVINRGF